MEHNKNVYWYILNSEIYTIWLHKLIYIHSKILMLNEWNKKKSNVLAHEQLFFVHFKFLAYKIVEYKSMQNCSKQHSRATFAQVNFISLV